MNQHSGMAVARLKAAKPQVNEIANPVPSNPQ
jgi:hypothetical protein